MEDLDQYIGDAEHDMWVDFDYHENTGELSEYFDDSDIMPMSITSTIGPELFDMARIFIETERLILREWKRSDRTDFAQMNCDEDVMKYFFSVLSREESDAFVDRIEAEISEYGYGLFAVELKTTGKFIGYVGFHKFSFDMPFSPGWEIGWRLDKRYWHNGYATEAAKACLEYAREQGLFNCLYSFTSIPNTSSENVMKRIGMVYQGNFHHPALPDNHWLKEHLLYKITL